MRKEKVRRHLGLTQNKQNSPRATLVRIKVGKCQKHKKRKNKVRECVLFAFQIIGVSALGLCAVAAITAPTACIASVATHSELCFTGTN